MRMQGAQMCGITVTPYIFTQFPARRSIHALLPGTDVAAPSARLRLPMQDEKTGARAGDDCIRAPVGIAELHQHSGRIERLHDRPDLPAAQPIRPQIGQKRDSIQHGRESR